MNAIQWTVTQVKQPGRPGSRKIDTHATIEQIIKRHGYCTSELLSAELKYPITICRERMSRAARRMGLIVVRTEQSPSKNGQRIKLWGKA